MPELLTMQDLTDGRLDVKALSEVVNGGDTRDVVTRLGTTYPSLAKAIKIILSQGTINATIYKTNALMTASSLPNDSYALVTDDAVGDKNGYYQKRAGAWVYLKYNPIAVSKKYSDDMLDTLLSGYTQKPVDLNPITGGIVNGTTPELQTILLGAVSRSYLKIDVSDSVGFTVANSVGSAQWFWVFTDVNDAYISKNTTALNGYFAVPSNAKWAYRTYQMLDLSLKESASMTFTKKLKAVIKNYVSSDIADGVLKANQYTDAQLYSATTKEIPLQTIYGFAADTSADRPNHILTPNADDVRGYITFDVSEYSSLNIKNTIGQPTWFWVFVTADNVKLIVEKYDDGKVVVPDGAVTAYKTVYYKKDAQLFDEVSSGLKITADYKREPVVPRVNNLENRIDRLEGVSSADKYLEGTLPDNIYDAQYLWSDSNLISPNDFEGANQMERIRAAIDFTQYQGFGVVELGYDTIDNTNTWTLTEAILIPSNCWIYINNSTVQQAPRVFDNMFRNAGIVPSPNPYNEALELNENTNIRIFGNDKTKSKIIGNNDNPYTAPNPVTGGAAVPWTGDYYGWRGVKILFANTKNYRVYNLSVSKVTSWSILNEHGCSNFKYHDIIFNSTVKNGDGINVRTGCSDFEIFNISGTTSDDMIAINTLLNFVGQHPFGVYVFPMQVGGYADRGLGNGISDGKIWNVKGGAVLVLCSGGGYVHDLHISDVSDMSAPYPTYAVRIGNTGQYGATSVMGNYKNITVRNISSKSIKWSVLELLAPIQDVWINNVTQSGNSGKPIIDYGTYYAAQNVKITNIKPYA